MATKSQRLQALELLRTGYSFDSVAAFFNVKPDTVRGWSDPEFAKVQASKFKARSFKKSRGWS